MLILASVCPSVVFANTYPDLPEESEMGKVINNKTDMPDDNLYFSLLDVYNKYYGLPRKDDNGTVITPSQNTIYKKMFYGMDFAYFDGVLDLSGTGGTKNNIADLSGLNLIDFSQCYNLNSINLSNNNIVYIYKGTFDPFVHLNSELNSLVTTLNLSNNNLSYIELNEFTTLRHIDLSNNQLTAVDFSFLNSESGQIDILLSNNNISKIENVTFKRESQLVNPINLYLVNSCNTDTYPGNTKINLVAGLVGLKTSGKYTKQDTLTYSKIDNLANIGLDATDDLRIVVKEEKTDQEVASCTFLNSTITSKIDLISRLNIGKYYLYFTDQSGLKVSSDNAMLKDQYDAFEIEIAPATPTYVVTQNGEKLEFESGDVIKDTVTVNLTCTDTNAKIFVKIGNGEWQEAESVDIEAGDYKTLYFKSVVDDIESETGSVRFSYDKSFGWSEVLALILIAVGFLLIFFVMIPVVRYFIARPIKISKTNKKDKK